MHVDDEPPQTSPQAYPSIVTTTGEWFVNLVARLLGGSKTEKPPNENMLHLDVGGASSPGSVWTGRFWGV